MKSLREGPETEMCCGHSGLSLEAAQTFLYISKSSAVKTAQPSAYHVPNCQSHVAILSDCKLLRVCLSSCGKVQVISVAFWCSTLLYCLCPILISKSDMASQRRVW